MDVIVSVPVLKGRSLSPRVVKSVLTQGGVSLQLCITAEESAAIPDFLHTFPDDLVHINSSLTPGIAGCHNYALRHYKAEYYVLMAPDTLLLPGALASLTHELRASPEIVLSFGTGYHMANLEFDLPRPDFRRQYAQLELMWRGRRGSVADIRYIKITRLHVIAVKGPLSGLLRQGLNPEFKELAPFEFVLRGMKHGGVLEHTSALTIAGARQKSPTIRENLSFFYQLSIEGGKNSSDRPYDLKRLFHLFGIQAVHTIEEIYLLTTLRNYLRKLRQRNLRSIFGILSPGYWLDLIGTSLDYRTFSEKYKNWRLLRVQQTVKPDQQKGPKVAYVLWRFPYFSETFIRRELDELVSSGINVQVFAEAPDPNLIEDEAINAWVNRTVYTRQNHISRLVNFILYFLFLHPIKTGKLFLYILFHRYSYYKTLREDLVVFGKSLYLAGSLRNYGIQHIHSPWANQTAFLSMGASYLLDLPFTVQVRAYDINHWKSQYGLTEILENADFIITNSEYNRSRINLIVKDSKFVYVIRNGVDTEKIIPDERPERRISPVRILSVGRLIEPKGYIYLLQACALLVDKGISFECKIYGGKNFVSEIRSYMDIIAAYNTLKLENWVSFEGAQPFEEILKSYQWADIFVLACVKSQTGEHDITPNAIIEAMAMELPVVSTRSGAIPEIVIHQKTGLLVEPKDVPSLTVALNTLIKDPGLRRRFGKAGRRQVVEYFNTRKNVSKMADLFNQFENQRIANDQQNPQ